MTAVWKPIAAAAAASITRRAEAHRARATNHVAALARYGLTPDTCPVYLNCPDLPDQPRSTRC